MPHKLFSESVKTVLSLFLAFVTLVSVCAVPAARSALAESVVSDENLFNKNDPYFMEGYNFVESTDQIAEEEDSFMTGFIPVQPNQEVRINLNSVQLADFVKYALYDEKKVWQDTVKVNDVFELRVRIFEPGFIRVTVRGLAFEDTIGIYISSERQENEDDGFDDTLLLSSKQSNIITKTTEEDTTDYKTDRFDRSDPDMQDRSNFNLTSGSPVPENNSFITGYIPVKAGDAAVLSLNSVRSSPFVKYALYDSDKKWYETIKQNNVNDLTVTVTKTGYIRFSIYGRNFKDSAAVYIHPAVQLSADRQIEDVILPGLAASTTQGEIFNRSYLSDEVINLFSTTDADFAMNQGFSQLTGDVVDDEGSFLTGFIPVVSGQVLIVSFTEQSAFAKYALFDKDKQWLNTTRVDNPTMLVVPIEETGYFRFHGYGKAITGTSITIPTVKKLAVSALSGDIENRLIRLENSVQPSDQVDVVIFMGQSNMAGRGTVTDEHPEDAPAVKEGAGWEFRSISNPTKLYDIDKTFGYNENVNGAVNDGHRKTGGLIPSFINAYYEHNGNVPVIGVSASEGGTSISDWLPGSAKLEDAETRLGTCVAWLEANNYEIRHKYMVWCQGEDDELQTEEWYIDNFNKMYSAMQSAGIEKCFVIRIGSSDPMTDDRINMIAAQTHLCQSNKNAVLVSTCLAVMLDRGLMIDALHYYQEAYNECGTQAGVNMAYYVTTGKEPPMYDPFYGITYYSSGY